MHRDLAALTGTTFDVAVVGGGIFGICAARDAALRGLSVALVEKEDFSHATSAHSFRMVHGGIRYLQHGDLPRIRESSRERSALLRTAPHLVEPLPIVIPTYRGLLSGRLALRAGLAVYDALTADRNRGITDPARRIPPGRLISRDECLRRFPDLPRDGLSGAAVFRDAQMYNPPRLTLAVLRSAVEEGAVAANYVEATGLLRRGDRVEGLRARDALTGDELEVRARVVLNAAGPWADRILRRDLGQGLRPGPAFSRDTCFIVPRRLLGDEALAVLGATSDPDALVSRGHRHLFIVPWRHVTLVGVWHVVWTSSPDALTVTEEELESYLEEINGAYPALGLRRDDVSLWNAGLVLFGENRPGARDLSYGKRSLLVDHRREPEAVEGLVSLVGVRWTTARGMAEKAVRMVCRKLGRRPGPSRTATTPVHGGAMESFSSFAAGAERPEAVDETRFRALLRNYGTDGAEVLRLAGEDPSLLEPVGTSTVLRAEVPHAVRVEMAQRLADVVLRRTDLGTAEDPGEAALRACAELMGRELGWDERRLRDEIAETRRCLPLPPRPAAAEARA